MKVPSVTRNGLLASGAYFCAMTGKASRAGKNSQISSLLQRPSEPEAHSSSVLPSANLPHLTGAPGGPQASAAPRRGDIGKQQANVGNHNAAQSFGALPRDGTGSAGEGQPLPAYASATSPGLTASDAAHAEASSSTTLLVTPWPGRAEYQGEIRDFLEVQVKNEPYSLWMALSILKKSDDTAQMKALLHAEVKQYVESMKIKDSDRNMLGQQVKELEDRAPLEVREEEQRLRASDVLSRSGVAREVAGQSSTAGTSSNETRYALRRSNRQPLITTSPPMSPIRRLTSGKSSRSTAARAAVVRAALHETDRQTLGLPQRSAPVPSVPAPRPSIPDLSAAGALLMMWTAGSGGGAGMALDENAEESARVAPPRAIADWMELAKEAGLQMPIWSEHIVEKFGEGIRWNDIFPPGQVGDWPSAASLKGVLRHRLLRDPQAFGELSAQDLNGLNQQQAIEWLRRLQVDERLPLEFDELFALPPKCMDSFIAEACRYEKGGRQIQDVNLLCRVMDFAKQRLSDEGAEVRYGRTGLGPPGYGSPNAFRGNEVLIRPRYVEHSMIWARVVPDDRSTNKRESAVLTAMIDFERSVSPFDSSPIMEIARSTKPHGWPEKVSLEVWSGAACKKAYVELTRLRGGKLSEPLKSAVGNIMRTAVAIESGMEPVSANSTTQYREESFRSQEVCNLWSVMQTEFKGLSFRGVAKKLLYLVEESAPNSPNAVRELLQQARPDSPRPIGFDAQLWDEEWLNKAAQEWHKLGTQKKAPNKGAQGESKARGVASYKDAMTSIRRLVRFTARQWWPGEMEWEGTAADKRPRHEEVSRWRDLHLDQRPSDAKNLKLVLHAFGASDNDRAAHLYELMNKGLPTSDCPNDDAEATLWIARGQRNAYAALMKELKDRGATDPAAASAVRYRNLIWRFAGVALSDMTNGQVSPVSEMAAERWTNHVDTAQWLRTLDQKEAKIANFFVSALEKGESDGDHALFSLLYGSRPPGMRPADAHDAAAWDDSWVEAACQQAESVLKPAVGKMSYLFEPSSNHAGRSVLNRLMRAAVTQLASQEAAFPYEKRDNMCPFRGDEPFGSVYGPLANAHKVIDLLRGGIVERMKYPLGIKGRIEKKLRSDPRRPMDRVAANKCIDALRSDGRNLLQRLVREELIDPVTKKPWPQRCYGRVLGPRDLRKQEGKLNRQGALFMRRPKPGEKAYTAQNGYFAGVYLGRLSVTAPSPRPKLPPGEHGNRTLSAVRGGKQFNFSASVFGNSMSLANVALLPDPNDPTRPIAQYDPEYTTAEWIPMDADILGNLGFPVETVAMFLLVYDRIFDLPPPPGRSPDDDPEIRVDCGNEWLHGVLAPELGLGDARSDEMDVDEPSERVVSDDDDFDDLELIGQDDDDPMDLDYRE